MNSLLSLFVSFFLIGLGAFGGGLAAVPLIQHELVVSRGWLSAEEMAKIVAIAQMTPGPVAVNAATFVGYRVAGLLGSAVATVAVITPAMALLAVLSQFMARLRSNRHVRRLRGGIRAGVLSLLLFAAWSYGSSVVTGWVQLAILLGALAVLIGFERKIHPIVVIIAAGMVGLLIF